MKIGLIDVDSKIPNLALMKISAYHKAKGDVVDFYNPLLNIPEKIYASKIFDFTDDYDYFPNPSKVEKGGSGYNLDKTLDDEIENQYPDYSLYNCEYAMGFTTRGCVRNCDFCIVPEKEGKIRAVNDIYDFWDGQEKLKLLDNNLTAHKRQFDRTLNQLIKENIKTDFNQGLDIRLITPEQARLLSKIRLWGQIHFAFDDPSIESQVRKGIKILKNNGVKPYKLMFYVLIGYDTTKEEDLHRVDVLDSLGVDPFVMPYDKSDSYQKDFARWVNHKAIFNSVKWDEYKPNVHMA